MQAFIDRFRYKATKARQAQSRLKAIAKLEPIPAVIEAPHVTLRFPQPEVPAPPLITLERAAAGYGDHVVLDRPRSAPRPGRPDRAARRQRQRQVDLRQAARRRSSRRCAGEVIRAPEAAGRLFRPASDRGAAAGRTARSSTCAARCRPSARSACARASAASASTQDKADLPAGALSGGEKARLTFALISAAAPQLLMLDEPTNHLDIDSREALIVAINDFAGAVILISHDPPPDRADRRPAVAGRGRPRPAVRRRPRRLSPRAARAASTRRAVGRRSGGQPAPRATPAPGRARAPASRRCARRPARPSASWSA